MPTPAASGLAYERLNDVKRDGSFPAATIRHATGTVNAKHQAPSHNFSGAARPGKIPHPGRHKSPPRSSKRMHDRPSRRDLLARGGAALAAAASLSAIPLLEETVNAQQPGAPGANPAASNSPARPASEPFGYCLNTSTIRGHNLSITEEIDIAAEAGYRAIEPWIGKIDAYVDQGGSLKDLAKRLSDHGMTVESSIGFAQWIVNDDDRRSKGMEVAKRDMDRIAQIGGKRTAAAAAGAQDRTDIDLMRAAERYRALLEL